MKNLYVNWLKEDIIKDCRIKKGTSAEKKEIGEAFKNIFNGAPFFENHTTKQAIEIIDEYLEGDTSILIPEVKNKITGFLVSTDTIPKDQQQYVTYPQEMIRYIEEIGVLQEYRGKRIASELVRLELINTLLKDKEYFAYRTNIMRYFKKENCESFESAMERIQEEDKKARENNEKIIIPQLLDEEKQEFVNNYISVIKKREDLDVSNSNRLFRSLFDCVDFCENEDGYTWQKDPTGENNDRVFPVVNLERNGYVKSKFRERGVC